MRYRTIVADPPWEFAYNGSGWKTKGQSGKRYFQEKDGLGYPTMPLEEIKDLPVSDLADHAAHLYLWIPDPLLLEGVAADVARSWGFLKPGRLLIWEKPSYGMGSFPRCQHEAVLVCRRGDLPFRVKDVGSVIRWKQLYHKGKVNSAKPEGFLDLVEAASPGPYVELFARRQRFGWDYRYGDFDMAAVHNESREGK